ncbi:MAG: RusA family crossover junction endodeoxyribonuclease [Mogibacterium sp.]|nr:RusA family crossover junction endodeoxyribonuclease [Mogibacterium sp.]
MRIFFELPENPKGTAQEKGTSVINGRVHHYEKKNVRQMRERYYHAIWEFMHKNELTAPHFDGPVALEVTFTHSVKVKKQWGTPKVTKPDLDNEVKLLIDVLADLEFFTVGDQQICFLLLRKLWGEKPTVEINIEPYECRRAEG